MKIRKMRVSDKGFLVSSWLRASEGWADFTRTEVGNYVNNSKELGVAFVILSDEENDNRILGWLAADVARGWLLWMHVRPPKKNPETGEYIEPPGVYEERLTALLDTIRGRGLKPYKPTPRLEKYCRISWKEAPNGERDEEAGEAGTST